MITPGFELTLPEDSLIPDEGLFVSNALSSSSSLWLDKTPVQILGGVNAALAEMNVTFEPPFEDIGYIEGMLIPKQACDWLRQWEQRYLIRLMLAHRRMRRLVRFAVKEKK